MTLRKQFDKTKPVCKVTFKLKKDEISPINHANLAGNFNDWDIKSLPMKKQKNGDFSVTVVLKKGSEYQFRYLVDGNIWVNEKSADKYVPNGFYGTNCVVTV